MNLDDFHITQPIQFNKGQLPYLLSSSVAPHVLWLAYIVDDKINCFFYNSLTNESTEVIRPKDLLAVNMIRSELMSMKWNEVSLPSIRIIMPNGDYKDL